MKFLREEKTREDPNSGAEVSAKTSNQIHETYTVEHRIDVGLIANTSTHAITNEVFHEIEKQREIFWRSNFLIQIQ